MVATTEPPTLYVASRNVDPEPAPPTDPLRLLPLLVDCEKAAIDGLRDVSDSVPPATALVTVAATCVLPAIGTVIVLGVKTICGGGTGAVTVTSAKSK